MMANEQSGRLTIDESLTWRMLDDDAVIVSPQTGKIRVLNHVGAYIWRMVVNGQTMQQMTDALVTNYGISHQQAQTDLNAFIDELITRNMIVPGAA